MTKPLITCLWFDGQAKEAADFYCSVFKNSKITHVNPMVVTFEINGSKLMGLNGGPHFKFDEAVSLVVECDTQEEIDYYWEKLIEGGGSESRCGWLKDKFGFSWQIVPSEMGQLMSDPARAQRIMAVVMPMNKLNIAKIKAA